MESLSGPLHSRKLSNGNGFSGKNAYDGVLFSGGQRKFGGPTFSAARAEDYREIFGSSTHGVSSIPVLDLSEFDDSSSNVRSSKPDYSKIFSGFKDDDVAVSHEELFGGVKGVKSSPEKTIRTPAASRQRSQDSEDLFDTSNQPVDAIKQFNVSYHKTTQRSNDGSNGTSHVAQLRDVAGFTCFIDEIKMAPEQKTQAQSQKGSATNIDSPNVDCNEGISEVKNSKKSVLDMGDERTSGSAVKSESKYSRAGSFFDEKLFNVHEINIRSHPSKLPPPSRDATSLDSYQNPSNGPTRSKSRGSKNKVQEGARGDISPPSSDEELDINSAAAASAAALRKAIEKAQESIRIAKESVGRKKEGLQSFSNRSFKDSLKVNGITDNVEACEKVSATAEAYARMERKDAFRDGEVYPGFKNSEKLFVARKVIGEMHEKISESARRSVMSNWYVPELKQSDDVPMAKEVSGEMSGKNLDSAEKCEAATWVSDHVNKEMCRTEGLAFEQAGSKNIFLDSADKYESEVKEVRSTNVTLKEECVKKAEAVEKACELEGMERKQNVEEDRLKSSCADKKNENGLAGSEQEEANREEPRGFYKLVNFVKNFRGFGDKMVEDKKVFDKLKGNDHEVAINGSHEFVEENKMMDFQEMMGNDQKEPQGSQEQSEIEKPQQKVFEEEYEGDAENEKGLGRNCNHNVDDQVLEEVSQWVETGPNKADASEERKQEDFHQGEAVEKWLDEVQELAINEKTQTYVHYLDESDDTMQNEFKVERNDDQEGENTEERLEESDANVEKESEETLKQNCGWEEGNQDKVAEDIMSEERESILGEARESIPSEAGGNQENGKIEIPQEVFSKEFFDRDCDTFSHDASSIAVEPQDACKIEIEINDNSCTPGVSEAFCEFKEEKAEAIAVANKVQEKEILAEADEIAAEDKDSEFEVIEVHEDFSSYHNVVELSVADTEIGENEIGESDEQSDLADGIDMVSNESTQIEEVINQEKTVVVEEQVKYTRERADIQKEEEKTVEIKDEVQSSQQRERKEDSLNKTTGGRKAKENEPRKEEEKKHLREVDEATKRQWEREKDKIAVERAIREARERAFAEARDRAERAAVEKATAEARQRVMAEAREKIEKVAAAAKSSSEKASVEAKLRAERAAVERATAEARERALEKAMSQKMTTSRSQSERFVADKFSGASRDHGNRQSSSSSDLHGSNGTNAESAQRSKARLETHNRIMERAAKALSEKEKRDHLAQKEQAERNRLAETLDADIKRWSSGKEGNLRALLSTLQYILGSGSGWQPVSLTEIITTSAVKKAYRKATLCVHPDKLQQRGASIQQKYVCEKVFDLLKAAWNRFNSEER